jgi:5-methylthioadenosine/S-adenosylhomocysteine deaminase
MTDTRKLLTADWALPVSAPAIYKAALVIEKNKINQVVSESELGRFYSPDQIEAMEETKIDYGQAVIMPGLINLHTHLDISNRHDLYYSAHDAMFQWMRQLVTGFSDWTPIDWQKSAFEGAAQSALSGTSCIIDMSFTGQSARQLAKIGLRGVVGLELFGQDESLAQSAWERWLKKLEFARQTQDEEFQQAIASGLVLLTAAPHAPYTVAPALWKLADRWCEENERPLLAHLSESKEEHEWIVAGNQELEDYLLFVREWQAKLGILPYNSTEAPPTPWRKKGRTPCEMLSDHGLLNKRLVAAHVVQADNRDVQLLAQNKVGIVHCPRSNTFLKNGVAPLSKFWEAGLAVGLGTDSLASNEDLNMLHEAASMLDLQHLQSGDSAGDSPGANEFGGIDFAGHRFGKIEVGDELNRGRAPKSIKQRGEVNPFHLGIKTITLDAAKVINMDERIGSLEAGKLADLAVFSLGTRGKETDGLHWPGVEQGSVVEELLIRQNPPLIDLIVDGGWVVKEGKLVALEQKRQPAGQTKDA